MSARPWVTGDPYLIDVCDVLRWTQVGSDDGTPVSERTVVQSGVGCRLDSKLARRYDIERRTNIDYSKQDNAVCLMPPDTNVRAGDKLVFTAGPQAGNEVQVLEIERAYGGFGVHHLEVQCNLVQGET